MEHTVFCRYLGHGCAAPEKKRAVPFGKLRGSVVVRDNFEIFVMFFEKFHLAKIEQ